ncbi:DUF3253 domain-containing protein [Caldovatus aquaticus]|uniref:DUF3253 domain-containing protein n=1 Tax=Caldovatus aquaticus TaxID=2865671 RepID=A0ABS7F1V2_9PROT|nr:DUF3253 domain-containing protein [Caldovatus aquaticus]MBW8269549.1 DUF3253 domain-containing protein [Caldovatus aquaticus]
MAWRRTDAAAIAVDILRRAAAAGRGRALAPDDVARARALHGAALRLAETGRTAVLRQGRLVASPAEARGVIRLRIAGA